MKVINSNNLTVAGLLGISALAALGTAQAAPDHNRKHDVKDAKHDAKRDIKEERRDVKDARHDVRDERKDVRKADTSREHREQQRELTEARRKLARQKAQLERERLERQRARNRNNSHWNNRPGSSHWNNRPGNWNKNRPSTPQPGYRRSDIRTFNGSVTESSNNGTFRVRSDNGGILTVRSTTRVRRGDRVHVSGYARNGIIDGAQVRRS